MLITRRSILQGALACAALPAARLTATVPADDISVLRSAYTQMHSGIYRYASPAQVEARLVALDREWQRTDDLAARYLSLSRFLGTVKCGHTYANFYNQKKPVVDALFAGRNRLPFRFRWIDGRMIVTAGGELPRGTEVLRIDGRPARDILTALMPLARADGGNDGKRRALLGVEGVDEYESFDIYYPLVFPAGDRFRLDVRLPGGARRSLIVDAIDLAGRQAGRPAGRDDLGWRVEHRGHTAIMTMPDWTLYESNWDWKGWITSQMDDLERRASTGLIIDIRANEGGIGCGDEIIARLIDTDLNERGFDRRVRFRSAPDDLIPYLDTWDKSFRHIGKNALARGDGFYDLPASDQTVIRPKGPRFRGRVIVLVGPQNSSATFQFASRMRQYRLGTLLGTTTGGNRRGINGGFFFLRLPGGIEADLPFIGYFPQTPQPDAGLEPDLWVADTAADVAAGRDTALERAVALLA